MHPKGPTREAVKTGARLGAEGTHPDPAGFAVWSQGQPRAARRPAGVRDPALRAPFQRYAPRPLRSHSGLGVGQGLTSPRKTTDL